MSSPTSNERIDFTEIFTNALKKILEHKSSRTQHWLGKEMSIAGSTLSKLFKGDTCLSSENLEKCAKYILKDSNRKVIGDEFVSKAKEYLMKYEAGAVSLINNSLNDKIERWLLANSDEALLVFFLSCSRTGVKLTHLQKLGQRHVDILNELIKKKWVTQNRKGKYIYYSITNDFNYKSNQLLKRFILLAASYTKPDHFNTDENKPNFGMVMTESINDKGMQEIGKELVSCSNKIEAILNNKIYEGDNPCSVTLLSDTLL